MGLQLEKGTQFPMRPTTALFKATADTLADQSGGLDWTAAASQLTLAADGEWMDDKSSVGVDTGRINVRPGVWKVDVQLAVDNGSATVETLQLAITNAAGDVVHRVTRQLTVPIGGGSVFCLSAVVHVQSQQNIVVRAVQRTAGTDLTITADEPIAVLTKIGNADEV